MGTYSVKSVSDELKRVISLDEAQALKDFISLYGEDERASVVKLVTRVKKALDKLDNEVARVQSLKDFDASFGDFALVAGMDEVGRGPIAGPVVTCAVIMKPDSHLLYVNDSKKVSEKRREELFDKIKDDAIAFSFGIVYPEEIDEINILNATIKAMKQSIRGLSTKPDLLVVDAVKLDDINIESRPVIKGDEKSYACACASILAKVYRDRMMAAYDETYKGYSFYKHKGYGTKEHFEAIKKYGITEIHRRSFVPDKYLS